MDQRQPPPPYDASQAQQNYGQPIHVHVVPPQSQTRTVVVTPTVIQIGRCPACQVGVLRDSFTCLGIFCAIFFFPIGILCCFMLTMKRCSNCGAHFG